MQANSKLESGEPRRKTKWTKTELLWHYGEVTLQASFMHNNGKQVILMTRIQAFLIAGPIFVPVIYSCMQI